MPVLPYLLELAALRQLPEATFATLMSFEPVLAVVVGAVVLGQRPSACPPSGSCSSPQQASESPVNNNQKGNT